MDYNEILSRIENRHESLLQQTHHLLTVLREGRIPQPQEMADFWTELTELYDDRRVLMEQVPGVEEPQTLAELRQVVEQAASHNLRMSREELTTRFDGVTSSNGAYAEAVTAVQTTLVALLRNEQWHADVFEAASCFLTLLDDPSADRPPQVIDAIAAAFGHQVALGLMLGKYALSPEGIPTSVQQPPQQENTSASVDAPVADPQFDEQEARRREADALLEQWARRNPVSVVSESSGKTPSGVKKFENELVTKSREESIHLLHMADSLLNHPAAVFSLNQNGEVSEASGEVDLTANFKACEFLFRRGYVKKYHLAPGDLAADYADRVLYARSRVGDGIFRKTRGLFSRNPVRSLDESPSAARFFSCCMLDDLLTRLYRVLPDATVDEKGKGSDSTPFHFEHLPEDSECVVCHYFSTYALLLPFPALLGNGADISHLLSMAMERVPDGMTHALVLLLGCSADTQDTLHQWRENEALSGVTFAAIDFPRDWCDVAGESCSVTQGILALFGQPQQEGGGVSDGESPDVADADAPDVLALTDIQVEEDHCPSQSASETDRPPREMVEEPVALPVDPGLEIEAVGLVQEPDAALRSITAMRSDLSKFYSWSDVAVVEGIPQRLAELLSAHRFADAYVLAKAAASRGGPYERRFRWLRYALDCTFDRLSYNSTELAFLDDDGEGAPSSLPWKIAILLRAAFAPGTAHDYGLINTIRNLSAEVDGQALPVGPSVKGVFSLLLEMLQNIPGGFSHAALQLLSGEDKRHDLVRACAQSAQDLLTVPNFSEKVAGIAALADRLFGHKSELAETLEIAINGDDAHRDQVAAFCGRFVGGDGSDDVAIDRYIQDAWTSITDNPNFVLLYNLRDKLHTNFSKRLDVLLRWLELTDRQSVFCSESLERYANQVKRALSDLAAQLEDVQNDGDALLYHMATSLCGLLSGEQDPMRIEMRQLLLTPHLQLTEAGNPTFLEAWTALPGCLPLQLALAHVAYHPREAPQDALEKINTSSEILWYSNYNQAALIEAAFDLPLTDHSGDILYAHGDLVNRIERIHSDLDLRLMNDCISEQSHEDLTTVASAIGSAAEKTPDYARANYALDCLEEAVQQETRLNADAVRRRAEVFFSEESVGPKGSDRAREMVFSALEGDRLSTAQDFLNRLSLSDTSFTEGSGGAESYSSTLQRYLRLYDSLSRARGVNTRSPLSSWGYSAFKKSPEWVSDKEWGSQHDQRAKAFLEAWPAFSTSPLGQPADLERFLRQLSGRRFGAVSLDKTDSGCAFYKAAVTPPSPGERDYEHPIAELGTHLPKQIPIILFAGNKKAEQIASTLRNHGLSGPALVLVDGFFTLSERRMLAEKIRGALLNILVLDHILALFLATQYDTERYRTLLACALPYAYSQPFTQDGNAVSDEMFVGRRRELEDIRKPEGPAIVYGGRQLGKTALLQRARSLVHKPSNRQTAIYFSALDLHGEAFVGRLLQELADAGVVTGCSDLPSACREIRRKIESGTLEYLLILVDEADALLREEQETDHVVLNEIINLRSNRPGNFKCVFAGLHNVMRSAKATVDNSPMTKLGNPLCIKPLSYPDARHLVRYPMSYLGITIGDSQLMTILTESLNYPGNLHLICGELVKDISDQFVVKYRNSDPPFEVDDAVLGGVVKKGSIRHRIRQKLMQTLELDPSFYRLACAIAYLGYESPDDRQAFSVEEISTVFQDSGSTLTEAQIRILLDEMCDMAILTKVDRPRESSSYLFRKNSFRQLVGTADDALQGLLGGV